MAAEIQKAMDNTFFGLRNPFCFLDDILIVSKRSEEDHKQYVSLNCLKSLDKENLSIILPKCHFANFETDWLGYHLSQSAILSPEAPKTPKKLRLFRGSVHFINKFTPNLVQISHPLRPLLKKSTKLILTESQENFIQVQMQLKSIMTTRNAG